MSQINKVNPRLKSGKKVTGAGTGKYQSGKTEVVKQRLVESGLDVPVFAEEGMRVAAVDKINHQELNTPGMDEDLLNYDGSQSQATKSYVILGKRDAIR